MRYQAICKASKEIAGPYLLMLEPATEEAGATFAEGPFCIGSFPSYMEATAALAAWRKATQQANVTTVIRDTQPDLPKVWNVAKPEVGQLAQLPATPVYMEPVRLPVKHRGASAKPPASILAEMDEEELQPIREGMYD